MPWRAILPMMSKENVGNVIKVLVKELHGWLRWRSIEAAPGHGAKRMFRDRHFSRRVLKSRFCYHDKNVGVGVPMAKARWTMGGHMDPGFNKFGRDSPTVSKFNFMFPLQAVCSMWFVCCNWAIAG